jgi:hypothetical protein
MLCVLVHPPGLVRIPNLFQFDAIARRKDRVVPLTSSSGERRTEPTELSGGKIPVGRHGPVIGNVSDRRQDGARPLYKWFCGIVHNSPAALDLAEQVRHRLTPPVSRF